jgi:hypothetical protein
MDRAALLKYLAQAERHIERGRAHIERQRELVIQLTRDGDAEELPRAELLLAQFEEMEATRIADRDRVLNELARLSPEEGKKQ